MQGFGFEPQSPQKRTKYYLLVSTEIIFNFFMEKIF